MTTQHGTKKLSSSGEKNCKTCPLKKPSHSWISRDSVISPRSTRVPGGRYHFAYISGRSRAFADYRYQPETWVRSSRYSRLAALLTCNSLKFFVGRWPAGHTAGVLSSTPVLLEHLDAALSKIAVS